jgi:hypothetical protein
VALLVLVPILVLAKADALTLRRRVTRPVRKLHCLRRVPVIQYNDFAPVGRLHHSVYPARSRMITHP